MTKKIQVPTKVEEENNLPRYATDGAAGADLKAAIKESFFLPPSESTLIPTGLRFAIPSGYEIQIRPRSGLAYKNQITVLNSPGTIDADYRGEVGVIIINHGKETFEITPGMRIAQMVLTPVIQAEFILEETLVSTTRGEGGFGHTGTR
ncbi:MAG: dUTP diphosphatase [Simkaniaceae bacterium]|nr:dUTP diphosphatase [Simkaniaceae bacterium]